MLDRWQVQLFDRIVEMHTPHFDDPPEKCS